MASVALERGAWRSRRCGLGPARRLRPASVSRPAASAHSSRAPSSRVQVAAAFGRGAPAGAPGRRVVAHRARRPRRRAADLAGAPAGHVAPRLRPGAAVAAVLARRPPGPGPPGGSRASRAGGRPWAGRPGSGRRRAAAGAPVRAAPTSRCSLGAMVAAVRSRDPAGRARSALRRRLRRGPGRPGCGAAPAVRPAPSPASRSRSGSRAASARRTPGPLALRGAVAVAPPAVRGTGRGCSAPPPEPPRATAYPPAPLRPLPLPGAAGRAGRAGPPDRAEGARRFGRGNSGASGDSRCRDQRGSRVADLAGRTGHRRRVHVTTVSGVYRAPTSAIANATHVLACSRDEAELAAMQRTSNAPRTTKSPRAEALRGSRHEKSRRRPTLPGGLPPSTIGAGGLNCRVRNGNGCFPAAMATGNRALGGLTDPFIRSGATPVAALPQPLSVPKRARARVGLQALGRLVPVG